MGSSLTRRQILESGAQRIGNASAHLTVYDGPFTTREAEEYTRQAQVVVHQKNWNEEEIARFRQLAIRRVRKELRDRMKKEHLSNLKSVLAEAIQIIDEFIQREMKK